MRHITFHSLRARYRILLVYRRARSGALPNLNLPRHHWQPRYFFVVMPDASTPTQPPPSKAKVFLRRLLSTVILWTVVLLALFSGYKQVSDYVFLVMIVVLAVTGLAEFYGLADR